MCLNKIILRHKLKKFNAFKSRFDRCLKVALKNALLNSQNTKNHLKQQSFKTQNKLRQRVVLPVFFSIY